MEHSVTIRALEMRANFVRAALDFFTSEEVEALRSTVTEVIVQGFSKVPLTPSFREAVAEAFGTPCSEIATVPDCELVKLGLRSLDQPCVRDAFLFHAGLVDRFWLSLSAT